MNNTVNMKNKSAGTVQQLQQEEAEFWNKMAHVRSDDGKIPESADIRRATRVIPTRAGEEPIDIKMSKIEIGRYRSLWLDRVAHKPHGRVLDVCCGPGWLSLELGRRGQVVEGYDISREAIEVARRTLAENPYKDGFGEVNYHVQDVTTVDLRALQYDAICGWSSFHHLPNVAEFMDVVNRSLKQDGVVATLDDLPKGSLDLWIERFFRLILPNYQHSYKDKLLKFWHVVCGKKSFAPEVLTPMEYAKHESHVDEIPSIFYEKFEVIDDVQFNAFVIPVLQALSGPDFFRYSVARLLVGLDRILCRIGVLKGRLRMIIARKKHDNDG